MIVSAIKLSIALRSQLQIWAQMLISRSWCFLQLKLEEISKVERPDQDVYLILSSSCPIKKNGNEDKDKFRYCKKSLFQRKMRHRGANAGSSTGSHCVELQVTFSWGCFHRGVEVVKGQSISRTGQNLPRTGALPFSVLPRDFRVRQGLRCMTGTGTVVSLGTQRHHHGDTEGSWQLSGWVVWAGLAVMLLYINQPLATLRCACCVHVKIDALLVPATGTRLEILHQWIRWLEKPKLVNFSCHFTVSALFCLQQN